MIWRATLTLGLLALGAGAQDSNTIRVPVRLVLVPTLVFSADGRALAGLEARDFSVFDNGVRQAVDVQNDSKPPSIVLAIQTNSAVSDYFAFVKKTGSLLENSLVGEGGRLAILTYGQEVEVTKPFAMDDSSSALQKLDAGSSGLHMLDAGLAAVKLLQQEDPSRPRILLFIGQSADSRSTETLAELQKSALLQNVTVHCLTLPTMGKKFVAETFSVHQHRGEQQSVAASVELMKLIPALRRATHEAAGDDPFSILANATGGMQIHFRKQGQLENALIAIGTAIRSSYLLSYSPTEQEPGYHRLMVQTDVQGSKTYSRPAYWR